MTQSAKAESIDLRKILNVVRAEPVLITLLHSKGIPSDPPTLSVLFPFPRKNSIH